MPRYVLLRRRLAYGNGRGHRKDLAGQRTRRAATLTQHAHGSDDPWVAARGGQQAADQFVQMNDLGDDGEDNDSIRLLANGNGSAPGGLAYTWNDYGFGTTTLIRHYVVTHMGHAWSGGDPAYPYAEARGPDQTALMWSFFEKYRRGGKGRKRVAR